MKNNLYVAIFLVLLIFSFTFSEGYITWMWKDRIQIPVILGSMALLFVGLQYYRFHTQKNE